MIVQAVDLAARFSAACLLGPSGSVISEYGSEYTADAVVAETSEVHARSRFFVAMVANSVLIPETCPDWVVVEDVPHQMRFDTITKAVCRLQGELISKLAVRSALDKLIFIPPALWQRHFPGVWKGGVKGAAAAASSYGYTPPDLLEAHRGIYDHLHGGETSQLRQKLRGNLKKQMSDYIDAFLIAQWAQETMEKHGTLEVKSAQKYVTATGE